MIEEYRRQISVILDSVFSIRRRIPNSITIGVSLFG
jgi:hypothetical protein